MVRLVEEDYETYIRVEVEYEIDDLYNNYMTTDDKLWLAGTLAEDGFCGEPINYNEEEDHEQTPLEDIAHKLKRYSPSDIKSLPDELIDNIKTIFADSKPVTIAKPDLLNEVKLMFDLYKRETQPHPLLDEISIILNSL